MKIFVPYVGKKRVVIVGAGFAGLILAKKLRRSGLQVVLIDKNNYHQFQPLLYQVATAGLESSSILFPLRKIFQKRGYLHIRICEVNRIDTAEELVYTSHGKLKYDYLVLATGTETNYFGLEDIRKNAIPMKSVSEAITVRNIILQNYEDALTTEDALYKQGLLTIAIVGGGPTGVEIAGALAEMKRFIFPRDYPELDFNQMQIHLLEASSRLLNSMSEKSSQRALNYLQQLGVNVQIGSRVTGFDGNCVQMDNGTSLRTHCLIWVSGVTGVSIPGLPESVVGPGKRLIVDDCNCIGGVKNIFAIGDIAMMPADGFPKGHPQVAQVAIQQAKLLAENIKRIEQNVPLKRFVYHDKGTMATVGRNKAVVELPYLVTQGFFAWLIWMFVHLMSIVGVKNRLVIFINWMWNYITYDQSLRLILCSKQKSKAEDI